MARGLPVIGLEPSCLYTLRDEFKSMLPGPESDALAARAVLFEEFLAAEHQSGRLKLGLQALPQKKALLHGHCHQKAFGAMSAVEQVLRLIPELKVQTVESGCCGMAGAFGYEAGGVAIPLVNYHNGWGAEAVAPEKVRLSDVEGGVRLVAEAAKRFGAATLRGVLRARLEKRHDGEKRSLSL